METLAMIDGMNSKNTSSPDGAPSTAVVSSDGVMSSPAHSTAVGASGSNSAANGEEVAQLKKSLQDVQVIAETRDKKIAEVSEGWTLMLLLVVIHVSYLLVFYCVILSL